MATLIVPGAVDRRPETSELARRLPGVTIKHAVRVDGTARADAAVMRLERVDDSDVIEMEFEDGLKLWSRVDDLQRDFRLAPARDDADGAIVVPALLPIGPASRGWGVWGIKALKVVGIDIAQSIAEFVADHVESQLHPGPGLYRCSDTDASALLPPDLTKVDKPTLLFLHGTASSTTGSFGGLWDGGAGAPIRRLFSHYGGRVLALQHRTLTESPIQNAAFLVERLAEILGQNAEVHLVSHSRGGLVGELLARGMRVGGAPFTSDETVLFAGAGRERDRAALDTLNEVLRRAQLRITRFVRVGCPARGTTLADGRLDRYFSVLVNVIGLIPGLKGSPIYDGLTSLLAGVLKQRTKPEDLPGLEAQMPGSPLVRVLNHPGVTTAADLHVLGGDLEGAGILGRLKTFATDLYYREDHDLVVNTPAMLGGTERTGKVHYWIDTGPDVTHFHYFRRQETAERLVDALITERPDEFHELTVKPFTVTPDDYRKRAPVPQPFLFVLPGIMGSSLALNKRDIWIDMFALAGGGLADLTLDSKTVEATALVRSAYGALCQYLSASHEVVPFPYDWRLSIGKAADTLCEKLKEKIREAEAHNMPIRLLAHSMGGLVVRAMLATKEGAETWAKICNHPGARFIMLGTPNRGSHSISAVLLGRDALVKKLALLDLNHTYAELLDTITSFPGMLELLPYAGTLDLLTTRAWQTIHDLDVPSDRGLFSSSVESTKSAGFAWPQPAADALANARAMRDKISNSPLDAARMIYVAGAADETACDILVDPNAAEGRRVRVIASAFGDGRVLWETGIPAGLPIFYMDAVHGDLANTIDAFPALFDLLTTGTTTKLPTTPPRRRSTTGQTFDMRAECPAMMPDRDELVASALGGRRTPLVPPAASRAVTVCVVHSDLSNATSPVLVGHYKDDVIIGAEEYLDRRASGRLRELRRMDLYPGAIGTAVVALNSQESGNFEHPGAIVAGLGLVGDLTPGALTTTVSHALTVYGAECVGIERRRRQRQQEAHAPSVLELRVSAVLVGSGEAGVSLSDSVYALLQAVTAANNRLSATNTATIDDGSAPELTARIAHIDIVELYSDRAIEALHALKRLGRSSELNGFVIDEFVSVGAGRRRRAYYSAPADWWQRIRVKTSDGGLQIEPLTRAARIPALLEPTSRRAVDLFLKGATGTTALDPAIGYTLFEMLVPSELKSRAPDRRRLLLMLDAEAAALPWELLHDRFEQLSRPLAVASSMIRQLIDDRPRRTRLRPTTPTALVVGNPVVTDSRFPTLAGAAAEAEAVTSIFRARNYEVVSLIGADATPRAVFTALHAKPWRVLHLAAHGVFEFHPFPNDQGEKAVSGLVLDDNFFFTAADAAKMRYVPDLVFINCCHLGQTAGEPTVFHELAANLAVQFIEMGARAVVAAGWAVHDGAAKAFAETLYEEMFAGETFGEAVARARTRVYDEFGATNTWGAYQCYGDPVFSLVNSAKRSSADAAVSEAEIVIAAEDIRRGAGTADERKRDDLVRQLDALARSVPAAWLRSPALCAAIGDGYGELLRFEEAIEYYERITTANEADAPIRALEQLANLHYRWALENGMKDSASRHEAVKHLERADAVLRGLLAIGTTPERLSMMGGLSKRQAMLSGDTTRHAALEAMRRSYKEALEFALKGGPKARAYPLANWLAAEVVLGWRRADAEMPSEDAKILDAGLIDLKMTALELSTSSTGFWDLSATADSALLTALRSCALDARQGEDVAKEYIRAGLRAVSPRERASMLDQIVFYRLMAETEAPDGRRDALIPGLDGLIAALKG